SPRLVKTQRPVRIDVGRDESLSPRVSDPAVLEDATPVPPFMMPPQDLVEPWIASTPTESPVGLGLTADDLAPMKPKALEATGDRLSLHVWPNWAGDLALPQGRSRSVTFRV